jgi:hypothetical protein
MNNRDEGSGGASGSEGFRRVTWIQAVLLVLSVVSVFAVLSIWVPVEALLVALVGVSFVGGMMLGRVGVVLVPLTTVVVVMRAEIISSHPLSVSTFCGSPRIVEGFLCR